MLGSNLGSTPHAITKYIKVVPTVATKIIIVEGMSGSKNRYNHAQLRVPDKRCSIKGYVVSKLIMYMIVRLTGILYIKSILVEFNFLKALKRSFTYELYGFSKWVHELIIVYLY